MLLWLELDCFGNFSGRRQRLGDGAFCKMGKLENMEDDAYFMARGYGKLVKCLGVELWIAKANHRRRLDRRRVPLVEVWAICTQALARVNDVIMPEASANAPSVHLYPEQAN